MTAGNNEERLPNTLVMGQGGNPVSEHRDLGKRPKRTPTRPDMPVSYGVSRDESSLGEDAWIQVGEMLSGARNYWLGTTRPDGRPHAMPVWGVWLDDMFWFATDRRSRKGRNLARKPALVVHLESGDNVCLLYTSPSPRDLSTSRMPSSA